MLAGELLEVMETLREMRNGKEGTEGTDGTERMTAVAKAIDSASRAIASVRAGDHNAVKLGLERERLKLERIRLDAVLNKAAERLLDEALRQRTAEIATSGMTNAEKIAALRKAAFADVDDLEASGQVTLPE